MLNKIDAVADPSHTFPMAEHVFKRDGRRCQYCGTTAARNYVMEHVIPWSMGGHTATYNLVVACASCNNSKRSSVWLPVNIHVLEQENPEWAEQIYDLASDESHPTITITIPAPLSWWFVRAAVAQNVGINRAACEAVARWTDHHWMNVECPDGMFDEESEEPETPADAA